MFWKKVTDGGQAFAAYGTAGMSLRDYFAGQAMVGQLSLGECRDLKPVGVAASAYEYADAMIKARYE